jgi:hypothetical protein
VRADSRQAGSVLDGYRMLVIRKHDRVRLITEGGYDWSKHYLWIAESARRQGATRANVSAPTKPMSHNSEITKIISRRDIDASVFRKDGPSRCAESEGCRNRFLV